MNAPSLRPTFAELEARLAAEGVFPAPDGAAPQPPPDDEASPWFTRVLVGLGAWVSALFFLGFVALLFRDAFGELSIAIGSVLIVAGTVALRANTGGTGGGLFLRQGALAGTLAGEGIFVFGISRLDGGGATPALAALAVTVAVAIAVRDPVARFLSTGGAAVALAWALGAARVEHTFDVLVLVLGGAASASWLTRPARFARRGEDGLAPAAYALTVAFFTTLLLATRVGPFADGLWEDRFAPPGRLSTVGLGIGAVAIAIAIRRELHLAGPTPETAASIAALALLGAATPGSPGLVAAVAIVLVALHRREPILLGMALVFLFAFLGLFYYAMTATLLAKAAYLGLVGAALLGGALVLARRARP